MRRFGVLLASLMLLAACRGPAGQETAPAATSRAALPASAAGQFYPADASSLRSAVEAMLASAQRTDGKPIAIIVPHAGYTYSGPVAAAAFKQLEGQHYDLVVVIGTNHTHPDLTHVAVYPDGALATPLGEVSVDAPTAAALVQASDRLAADPGAFAGEHSVENELPFLQQVLPGTPIVPVLVGSPDPASVTALAEALSSILAGRDALIVASSDLSHYPSYEDARTVDGATLAAVAQMDPSAVAAAIEAQMARGIPNLATCACGEAAILAAMRAASALGANRADVLVYRNSGDMPDGDTSQVVGYAAVKIWRDPAGAPAQGSPPVPPPAPGAALTEQERSTLLELARASLDQYLRTGTIPLLAHPGAGLGQVRGVFVTLTQDGQLRGCMGSLVGQRPLDAEVQHSATMAATQDPRFPPVGLEELGQLRIEISVLGPLVTVGDVSEIEVGRDGLLIEKDDQRGTLLPQVPVENGWDRSEFVVQLCRKAGLPDDAWRDATLYRYTAEVFHE